MSYFSFFFAVDTVLVNDVISQSIQKNNGKLKIVIYYLIIDNQLMISKFVVGAGSLFHSCLLQYYGINQRCRVPVQRVQAGYPISYSVPDQYSVPGIQLHFFPCNIHTRYPINLLIKKKCVPAIDQTKIFLLSIYPEHLQYS